MTNLNFSKKKFLTYCILIGEIDSIVKAINTMVDDEARNQLQAEMIKAIKTVPFRYLFLKSILNTKTKQQNISY